MDSKNIILSIEGSSENFSISLFYCQKLVQEKFYFDSQTSDILLPAIDKILKETGFKKEEIGAIFTTTGPGSFTSVRVLLSSLSALSLGLNIPIYALDSLKASALVSQEEKRLVVLKAYNRELYTAIFTSESLKKEQPTKAKIIQEDQFSLQDYPEYCLIGDGIAHLMEKFQYKFIQKTITKNYLQSSLVAKYLWTVKDLASYKYQQPTYLK